MPMDQELVKVVKEYLQKRSESTDKEFLFAAERVDLKIVHQLQFEARRRQFSFYIDEPPERGGNDTGLNPLAYFIAGAASCLLNQYGMLAMGRDITLQGTMNAKATFERRMGGAFTAVDYDIRLESTAPEGEIRRLADDALSMCYANNTLRKAGVKIAMNVSLNGKAV